MSEKSVKIIIIIIAIIIVIGIIYLLFFNKKGKSLPSNEKANCDSKYLFIGDSLTAFDQSYADQLFSVCPNITIRKIAKAGEKTDWMLQQLQSELNSNKYDVVSIWGGVNDIYARNSISEAELNLQKMYDLVKSTGAKVVALTVIPTRTYNASDDNKISLTNSLNKWISSNRSVDGIVDVNSIVNDGNDGTKSEYLQPDTLHINEIGQGLISNDFVKKIINK